MDIFSCLQLAKGLIWKIYLLLACVNDQVYLNVTGNLGRVDYITEYEYDLFIRPDTCNPRFRVWFNFTVENVKADQVFIYCI
jgi:hypothetical protein